MTTSTSTLEDPFLLIENLKKQNQKLTDKITLLEEQLAWFTRQIFGKRSEKINPLDKQELLPGFELPQIPNPISEKKKKETSTSPLTNTKNRSNKLTFPENLPIEQTIVDLNDEEKVCPETGKPLIKIGEDVTQKLAHKPGSYYIKEIIRPKYAAFKDGESTIISADLPDSIIPGCKADESLLAEILVNKFADHLPLYRQSEIVGRNEINIPRQLLAQWVVKCGLALKPLFDRMLQHVLESNNIFIDEVPVNMLKPGKGSVHQAYMWVIVGGEEFPAYRVYNFRTSRSHVYAEDLLKNYKGVLHSDKYGAYEKLAQRKEFAWCPCWAHIRRKFFEAESGDPGFRRIVLRKIRHLFMYERVAWNRSAEERLRIRQQKEIPIIDELIVLIKDKLVNGNALAKSKFKEALGYFCSLIPYLKNYTLTPYARMDNNVAERAVRPLAIGRKNWLFLGSEEGGEAASIVFSLVQTCRFLEINPRIYLEDVMRRILSHPFQKLDELLPDKWLASKSKPA